MQFTCHSFLISSKIIFKIIFHQIPLIMKKYITEFIGTFFLVLIVVMTAEPYLIGSMLMVMVFAGGHISGAHYNPAVTLAVWLRGKINSTDAVIYMLVQIAGATAAAFLALWLLGNPQMTPRDLSDQTVKAIVSELIGTFALAYVVLNVATAKGTSGNSFYGLAIGFTIFVCAIGLGKISGGAFNPSVAFGLCVAKAFAWKNIWIYLVGCFGGGALAALVFKLNNPEDN
jgi:aquaporin Z